MEISNTEDIIDSRDIIERIEELEDQMLDIADYDENYGDNSEYLELKEELDILKEVQDYASASPDWEYGEVLIRDSYFDEYIQDFCKDIGVLPSDIPWWIEIDWEATAENLKADYFDVDYDGVTYWIRG